MGVLKSPEQGLDLEAILLVSRSETCGAPKLPFCVIAGHAGLTTDSEGLHVLPAMQ